MRGEHKLAEKQATELLEVGGHSGDPQEGHNEVLGIIRWHPGRLFEALPILRATLDRLPDLSNGQSGLAFAQAVTGDRRRAGTMLSRAADNNFEMLYGPAWLGCTCQWAAVAAELGDTRAAAILYRELHPWKELFGTTGPIPIHGMSHALGRLAALLGEVRSAPSGGVRGRLARIDVQHDPGTLSSRFGRSVGFLDGSASGPTGFPTRWPPHGCTSPRIRAAHHT